MYKTLYVDKCQCPYCEAEQDVDMDGDVWREEIECDGCGGKFIYSLEITIDFTCEPILGEGPGGEEGSGPKWIDPNQINIFQGTCT